MGTDAPLPDVLERLERAEELKMKGKHSEALDILEELLLEDPENVSALEEIADNELSLERFVRANAAAKRAVALDDESYTGHYILGFIHSHAGEWMPAMMALQKANRFKANNPEILRCLGWALFCGGERAQGIVTLERSLNLDRENVLTLCDLGIAYLQVKSTPKAKALFEEAVVLEPGNPRAKECLDAVMRMERGQKKMSHVG